MSGTLVQLLEGVVTPAKLNELFGTNIPLCTTRPLPKDENQKVIYFDRSLVPILEDTWQRDLRTGEFPVPRNGYWRMYTLTECVNLTESEMKRQISSSYPGFTIGPTIINLLLLLLLRRNRRDDWHGCPYYVRGQETLENNNPVSCLFAGNIARIKEVPRNAGYANTAVFAAQYCSIG